MYHDGRRLHSTAIALPRAMLYQMVLREKWLKHDETTTGSFSGSGSAGRSTCRSAPAEPSSGAVTVARWDAETTETRIDESERKLECRTVV